ncbi:MAG: Sulfatase, partial [Pedosphaera sp.]|nr:Sulfatase [Pedosphaera sp.]
MGAQRAFLTTESASSQWWIFVVIRRKANEDLRLNATEKVSLVKPKSAQGRSRFGLAAVNFLALLFCFSVLRVVLFCLFKPQPPAAGLDVLKAFAIGLHFDIFVALALSLPLIFWLAVVPDRWFRAGWHRLLFKVGFFLYWFIQVFLIFAEYYFFEEFKSRFNTVAVDYLIYPQEVAGNIWDSYPVAIIVSVCGVFAVGLLVVVNKLTRSMWDTPTTGTSRMSRFAGAVLLCVALWFTMRPGEARFSNERIINELANNGTVAFVTAAWSRNLDYAPFYRTLPAAETYQRTHRLLTEPNATFIDTTNSTQRRIAGGLDKPKYNVVIMLEESLGSEFWGCLGRPQTLTPEMDRLATEEGMLFTNLYASGNRTVRG